MDVEGRDGPDSETPASPPRSSLLSMLANFDKSALKKTDTRVETIDGRRVIEGKDEHSDRRVVKEVLDDGYGFVGDTRKDRQVGEIRPWLILGSMDAAHDFDLLKKYNVSHVLNTARIVENMYPEHFTYKLIDILDMPGVHIIPHFQDAFNFIDDAKESGSCCLVHCYMGVSRSATIVIAYLMKTEGMSLKDAFNFVKSKRSAICPNPGFKVQLETFEERLNSSDNSK